MEYLIYDRMEDKFLVKLNTQFPLNSEWGGRCVDGVAEVGRSGVIGAEVFHWESGAKHAVKLLETCAPNAATMKWRETDFVLVKAKPTTVHEFQDDQIIKKSIW
jgi:hypothetical protein